MSAPPVAAKKQVTSFFGMVVGTAMQKTIKVRVARSRMHPVVQKPVIRHKNFLAHDEREQCVIGDWVRIDQCRKISKRKNFTLGEIIKPAARYTDEFGVQHSQAAKIEKPDAPNRTDIFTS